MNIGVIFAGGAGKRMHTKEKPKQFLEVFNKPIIVYTLEKFEECPDINAIVVVCIESWIEYLRILIEKHRLNKVIKIVKGGSTGQESIYKGLKAAYEVSKDSIVLIHDGVRPFITSELLSKNINCVKNNGSCITAGIVKETIVVIDDEKKIVEVPSRNCSRVAKAPQSFYLQDILGAHQKAINEKIFDFIDSCTMMKYYGFKMYMIDGPYENIKITTPDDYYTMRAIIQAREDAQIYGLD